MGPRSRAAASRPSARGSAAVSCSSTRAFAETLASLTNRGLPAGTVRLEAHRVGGQQFLVAWDRNGERQRIDHGKHKAAATARVEQAAQSLRPDVAVRQADWLATGDAYYYDHHDLQRFPVYRIVYDDGERFYLDPLTAEVVFAVDTDRQLYRWLHYGLHRGDFEFMRGRPVWDTVMLTLLGGVTIGVATGVLLGFRRIGRLARTGKLIPVSARLL